jgi:hypothetical protein
MRLSHEKKTADLSATAPVESISFFQSTHQMLNGSAALPFVIPTGAKRSGGICSSTDLSWKCFAGVMFFLRKGLWGLLGNCSIAQPKKV